MIDEKRAGTAYLVFICLVAALGAMVFGYDTAVGAASVVAPMYIAEVSPARLRGRMVAITQINIVLGMLVAYVANYYLVGVGENNWRWMFLALGAPAVA